MPGGHLADGGLTEGLGWGISLGVCVGVVR